MARLPLSWSVRVPVPVKCGCEITGALDPSHAAQSLPVQRSQQSFS
jgi:hypothetical protein